MNKSALVIGGIAVAIIAVVLYVMVHSASGSHGSSGGATASTEPTTAPKTVAPGDPGGTHDSPALPAGSAAASDPQPTEVVSNGVHVRDHRRPDPTRAPDVPPNIHPENSRKLPAEMTQGIAQQVKAVMIQCTRDLPKEARGTAPRLEGQLVVGVTSGTLSVTGATLQLRDVTGAAADPTRLCIEQKSVGTTLAAPDEPDLDRYTINISFAIP